jgi:hypothetical protein
MRQRRSREGDDDPAYSNVRRPVVAELGYQNTNEYHGYPHHERTDQKHGLTTKFVDDSHGGQGADEEDYAGHSSG